MTPVEQSGVSVTIYSGPGCYKCKYTASKFKKEGVAYTIVEDPERARLLAENNGLRMSLPVVVVTTPSEDGYVWSDLDTRAIDNAIHIYRQFAEIAV